MIKIDLSRAIPPRFGTYLLGIIPGLVFESSVGIGQPHLAASVISRIGAIHPFGTYALVVIFLASALFIGQGFYLLAWIADLVIGWAFILWRYGIRITLGSNWLYRRFAKRQGAPPAQNPFTRFLGRVIFWARMRESPLKARPVLKCLHIATKRLLYKRYGIDRTFTRGYTDASEWEVWQSVLGKPLKDFQDASIAARIFLSTGFAGFMALYPAPTLRAQYFIALCFILTFGGAFTSVNLALWRFSPVRRSVIRLRSVLLELSTAEISPDHVDPSSEDSSETVDGDDPD
jgi:hypothetical protein